MADRGSAMSSGDWLGYHLFPAPPFEPYLVHHLAPLLRHVLDAGTVRRAFFIRYGEGRDAHVRLRLLPRDRARDDRLRSQLERSVMAHLESAEAPEWPSPRRSRVEEHPYSRSVHYFGHNRSSVYAELLNEATSWLALDLLGALGPDDRTERWLVAACLSERLLESSARGPDELRASLEASAEFAATACRRFGSVPAPLDIAAAERRASAVARARPAVGRAFRGHPSAARAARLLRRMGRRGDGCVTVATHGLHLLWNKLGFSLAEELGAFEVLCRLRRAARAGAQEPDQHNGHEGPKESVS